MPVPETAEHVRLAESAARRADWKKWGPYLSERAWGTIREDYSPGGTAWDYLPHDHARSRAYRWSEDGLGGFCNSFQNICLAVALWNEKDPILKERLFGVTGPEGNHGEDVKEYYFYLDGVALACLHENALPVSAGGVPLRRAGRSKPPARAEPTRVRAGGCPAERIRRKALF